MFECLELFGWKWTDIDQSAVVEDEVFGYIDM